MSAEPQATEDCGVHLQVRCPKRRAQSSLRGLGRQSGISLARVLTSNSPLPT